MHLTTSILVGLTLSTTTIVAFPAQLASSLAARSPEAAGCPHLQARRQEEANKKRALVGFNAKEQYVDVTGKHKFVPPGPNDQRGPCPGLNALANHNFLPHNGVATAQELINATNLVYGMALDLGGFLATFGTIMDGNPLSLTPGYSIGGPVSPSDPIAGRPLNLGQPQGLSGSHNKYESDASATRGDLYLYGNDYKVQLPQFEQYYDALLPNTDADTQYAALASFHNARHQDSISRNPNFFFAPFAGVLVTPAAFNFPPRMMANHSAQYPNGYLDHQTFQSFFAVTGTPGNFIYKAGWERIPSNWYRRPLGNDYTIPAFLVDVLAHGAKYPQLLVPGGNTGKTNSFTPLNVSALTHGVYSASNLLQGNNLECFAFQLSMTEIPDILVGVKDTTLNLLASLVAQVTSILAGANCPKLQAIDKSQYKQYPGYNSNPF